MKECPTCHNQSPDEARECGLCGHFFDSTFSDEQTKLFAGNLMAISRGDLIHDRYKIVRKLGRGGMGTVYLVHDTRLQNRLVALKMIHPQFVEHHEAKQRFKQEVVTSLEFHHSSIVKVYNLEEWQGLQYFTMEYVDGRSLRYLINKRKSERRLFSPLEVTKLIDLLLKALSHAHQKAIHRDIKPENIIVTGEFPTMKIKVLDFGIAKTLSASQFTQTQMSLGTAYYMAPEQLQERMDVDVRADLYAVGMIIYELLTGEIAQGRFKLPGELIDNIPKELDKLVDMALSPRPDERYVSAEVMRAALPAIEPLSTDPNHVSIDVADLFCHGCGTLLKDNYFKCKKCGEINCNNCRDTEKRGWCLECRDIRKDRMLEAAKSALPPDIEIRPYNKKPFSSFENSLGMKFVLLPPGSFMMGSPPDVLGFLEKETFRQVTLTKEFYMQTTPVTQAQWQSVMGNNPSYFIDNDVNRPVGTVSWDDVQEFIGKLNSMEGTDKYRLPTEAEWEYACRAGSETFYYFGDSKDSLTEYAWWGEESHGAPHPVGQKKPNSWGLYDMYGNVWEWCQDWLDDYPTGAVTDPRGPSSGTHRVYRGGNYRSEALLCRSAFRSGAVPDARYFGFRLTRAI